MPTTKVAEIPRPEGPECAHPEHEPSSMMHFPPGVYVHTCPACGGKMTFTIFEDGLLVV